MRFVEPALSETAALNVHQDFVRKNNRENSTFKTWAIYQSKIANNSNTSKAIGFVVLYSSIGKQQLSPAEIGIMLLPEHSGKGIATKALSAFLTFLFGQLKLPAIAMRFYPENKAMRTISAKLGFSLSNENFINNKQSPADNMLAVSLSARHWQAQKQPSYIL